MFWALGGSWSTWRNPTQTQGNHADSSKNGANQVLNRQLFAEATALCTVSENWDTISDLHVTLVRYAKLPRGLSGRWDCCFFLCYVLRLSVNDNKNLVWNASSVCKGSLSCNISQVSTESLQSWLIEKQSLSASKFEIESLIQHYCLQ